MFIVIQLHILVPYLDHHQGTAKNFLKSGKHVHKNQYFF